MAMITKYGISPLAICARRKISVNITKHAKLPSQYELNISQQLGFEQRTLTWSCFVMLGTSCVLCSMWRWFSWARFIIQNAEKRSVEGEERSDRRTVLVGKRAEFFITGCRFYQRRHSETWCSIRRKYSKVMLYGNLSAIVQSFFQANCIWIIQMWLVYSLLQLPSWQKVYM